MASAGVVQRRRRWWLKRTRTQCAAPLCICAADFCVAHALLLLPLGRGVSPSAAGGLTPFYGTAFVRRSPGDARPAAVGSFGILGGKLPATPLRQWVFPSLFNPTAADTLSPHAITAAASPRAAVFLGALVLYLSGEPLQRPRAPTFARRRRDFHPLDGFVRRGMYILLFRSPPPRRRILRTHLFLL